MNVDYLENLSIPVKFIPQSLHWSHAQVTTHSGILKTPAEKHTTFTFLMKRNITRFSLSYVLKSITKQVAVDHKDLPVIMESDNCRPEYKSTLHFWGMEKVADEN